MTVTEFMQKKNEILRDITGLTLVPEEQIVEVPKTMLNTDSTDIGNGDICPYCRIFMNCNGCPMDIAGNNCDISDNSTYEAVATEYNSLRGTYSFYEEPMIKVLVEQYNKELGE